MVKLIICDDEAYILRQTEQYLQQIAKELSLELAIKTFFSGEALLTAFSDNQEDTTIIILDVEMPGLDGLEIAKGLRESYGYKGVIVFLTNHERQLLTSEEIGKSLLLKKSGDYYGFEQLMKPVISKVARDTCEFEFKLEGGAVSVKVQDILMLKTQRFLREQRIYLKTKTQEYVLHESWDQVKQLVLEEPFCQINQHLIVNLNKVVMLTDNHLLLEGDTKVKLHRKDKKALQERLFQVS